MVCRIWKYALIATLIHCAANKVFSQDNHMPAKELYIEAFVNYGFIMPHVKAIEYLVEGHIPGFELRLSKATFGKNIWEQQYNYPRIGAGYYYCNYNNPDVLGKVNALYSFINIPIVKKNERFSFNYEIDLGVSYITKIFDIHDNYKNIAIGTHGNVFFKTGVDTKVKVFKNTELVNSLSFSHCSNGRVKEPNLGINVVSASVGLSYYLGRHYNKKILQLPEFIRTTEYSVIASGGIKQWRRHDQNDYFASSLVFNMERHINNLQSIGIGLDIFYDASIATSLEYFDEDKKVTHTDLYRSGIHLSHNLIYNRLSLVFNAGYYFYTRYVEITSVYSRLGLRYKISNHLLANLTLKSHFAQADFIEWGIGYYWKNK